MAITRTSPYYELMYTVECKPTGQAWYGAIAAFNHPTIAELYRDDCKRANPTFSYRLMKRTKGGFIELTR